MSHPLNKVTSLLDNLQNNVILAKRYFKTVCTGKQAGGRITAQTLPANRASKRILELNGFECVGIVYDDEDAKVLEWIFKNAVPHNRNQKL